MILKSILQSKRFAQLSLWIVLLIVSTMVLGSFIQTNIDGYERAMFKEMINGTAHKPFIYRALVPIIIKSTSLLIPENVKEGINVWGKENINYLTKEGRDIDLLDLLFAIGLWYVSIICFAFVFQKLAHHFYSQNNKILFILTIIAVAGLPTFFKYYSYIYDLTHLSLFTFCLYLLVKANWKLYLLLICVTTLSKETSVLLIMIYYIHYKSILSKSDFNKIFVAQMVIFIIIKMTLSIYYFNNSGTIVEFQLFHNLKLEPYSISQFLSFIIIGVGIAFDWKNKPLFLKNAFYIIIPLLFLTFFLGYLDEYRDYYEIYPIVLLLIFHSVTKLFNNKLEIK
ncbi:MAG: hypothetical protein ABIJ40_01765 [Bacteroidota bacterium]